MSAMDNTFSLESEPAAKRIYISIGTKITLLLGTAVVLASCAIGLATYWHFDDALVRRELSDLNTVARAKASHVVSEVSDLSQDAQFFASIAAIKEWIRARQESRHGAIDPALEHRLRERLETTFLSMLRAKPEYYKIRFIGVADGGREIVRTERSVSTGEVRIVPDNELQRKSKEPFFQSAIQTAPNQVDLSDINLNHEQGKIQVPYTPVLRASVPIYDADGVVFGFVIINRFMAPFFDSLVNNLEQGQVLMLVNEQGEYLMHPDPTRTFGFDLGESFRIQDDRPLLKAALNSTAPDQTTLVESSSGRRSAVIVLQKSHFDASHPERFVAFVLTTSYDQVVADSNRARSRCAWIGGAVLLVVLGLGHVFSRSVTRPLRLIALAVEKFGHEQSDVALPLESNDETGVVARSLRQMIDQVRGHTASLQAEVAERMRAEQESRDKGARYQAILDHAGEAIITINSQGIIESFNWAAERIFRCRAEAMIGQNVRVLMPSPYREGHDGYIRKYRETSIAKIIGFGREVVGVRADGTTFPLHLNVSEVKLGNTSIFTGILRDISRTKQTVEQLTDMQEALTARAYELEAAREVQAEMSGDLEAARMRADRAERDAREQAARTQAVLEGANDAIITIGFSGQIDGFNAAAERMFGYRADEAIGINITSLVPTSDHEEFEQYLRSYFQTEAGFQTEAEGIVGNAREMHGIKLDSTVFPVCLSLTEIRLDDRQLFTVVFRDMTERNRTLEKLTDAFDELSRRGRRIDQLKHDLDRSTEEQKQLV
jgi:PAS domain S-box-containing protein